MLNGAPLPVTVSSFDSLQVLCREAINFAPEQVEKVASDRRGKNPVPRYWRSPLFVLMIFGCRSATYSCLAARLLLVLSDEANALARATQFAV